MPWQPHTHQRDSAAGISFGSHHNEMCHVLPSEKCFLFSISLAFLAFATIERRLDSRTEVNPAPQESQL